MNHLPENAATLPTAGTAPAQGWRRVLERTLDRLSDRLNPILVKEARQALKSRQFGVTFGLLLVLAWGWSLVGVVLIGPQIVLGASGPEMFQGYYFCLAFSLVVIVPFGAFRSLACEQEDHTYELLWITTLTPRQIVSGKLSSAVVQMLIYLSAMSPCLAFTYMLRGIDFFTIFYFLFWTIVTSLALAVVGLLAGTLTEQKQLQVVLSVFVIVGLLCVFLVGWSTVRDFFIIRNHLPLTDPVFWQYNIAVLVGVLSVGGMVFYAAVARITFASDNRSTRLRMIMFLQHLILAGCMTWLWIGPSEYHPDVVMNYLMLANFHWFLLGAFMTGESPDLSLRARRTLPQSMLGRIFFTWFNPGPATGFVLALCGSLAAMILATGSIVAVWQDWIPMEAYLAGNSSRLTANWASAILIVGTLATSYLVAYLGFGRLLIQLARQFSRTEFLSSLLAHLLLVTLGCGLPPVIQGMAPKLRDQGYTLLQMTNVVQTLRVMIEKRTLIPETPILLTVVPLLAAVALVLNLPSIVRELRLVHLRPPKRVLEEDAALAAPAQPLQSSPWDVP